MIFAQKNQRRENSALEKENRSVCKQPMAKLAIALNTTKEMALT